MQPSKAIRAVLICAAGGLFFLMAFLSQSTALPQGATTAILAGACVLVLGVMWWVARRARTDVAEKVPEPVPVSPGARRRTLIFLAALALLETTQIPALPYAAKAAAVALAAGLAIWAVTASRRARRG